MTLETKKRIGRCAFLMQHGRVKPGSIGRAAGNHLFFEQLVHLRVQLLIFAMFYGPFYIFHQFRQQWKLLLRW